MKSALWTATTNLAAALCMIALLHAADMFLTHIELATCETDWECERACTRLQLKGCEDVMGEPASIGDEEPAQFVRI